jgi:hypothetical protein
MAIVINGSGTVTGLAVGGLPDGTVDTDTLANTTVTAAKVAADVATQAELDAKLNLTGGTLTGNLTISSTATDDNINPDLILYRNSSSPADNDNLGGIKWQGNDDGGNAFSYAQIVCKTEDVSDGTEDGLLRFYTATGGSMSEKMRITKEGYIGIGTTTPGNMLHIEGALGNSSPSPMIYIRNTNGPAEIKLQAGGDSWTLDTDYDADNLIIRGSGTEVIRFKQDGRGLSQFTAKAWVRVDMSNMHSPDSHNVSSVTDIATGKARINFANNMANSSYNISTSANDGGLAAHSNITASDFYLRASSYSGSDRDDDYAMALVFGD